MARVFCFKFINEKCILREATDSNKYYILLGGRDDVVRSTLVAELIYSSPYWWVFAGAADRGT